MQYKKRWSIVVLFGALLTLGASTPSNLIEALDAQRALTANRPGDAEVLNDFGNLLVLAGELEEAEEAYRQALQIAPEGVEIHYNLGLLLQQQGEPGPASQELQLVIELDPDHAWAHYQLGQFFAESGNRKKALDNYSRAFYLDQQLTSPAVNAHIVENNLASQAMLMAYGLRTAADEAPRMYGDAERIASLLAPETPTQEDSEVDGPKLAESQATEVGTGQVRVWQPRGEASRAGTSSSRSRGGAGGRTDAGRESSGAASDSDRSGSSAVTFLPNSPTARTADTGAEEASRVATPTDSEESETETDPEPNEDESAESPEDDYEPAAPSTGRTGTQVVPGDFGSGVPSTARLDTKLLTEADERPSAG